MQTDKKPSALSTQLFDMTKSFSNASAIANLYGKMLMIKEMQLFLINQEKEINEQIKKSENNV